MEEIADIEDNSYDPFYADAVKNEGEIDLSEEQKRKFKRVKLVYLWLFKVAISAEVGIAIYTRLFMSKVLTSAFCNDWSWLYLSPFC